MLVFPQGFCAFQTGFALSQAKTCLPGLGLHLRSTLMTLLDQYLLVTCHSKFWLDQILQLISNLIG